MKDVIRCPTCGVMMRFTEFRKGEGGRVIYLYKCPWCYTTVLKGKNEDVNNSLCSWL